MFIFETSHLDALSLCGLLSKKQAAFFMPCGISAIASRQAELRGSNADEMRQSAEDKALDVLGQEGLAESMASRRCQHRVRNSMMSLLPKWEEIKANEKQKICVCVESPYSDELDRFKKTLSDRKLDELVARYPLHKSNVFDSIAKALHCVNSQDYEKMVVTQSRTDEDLVRKLRQRINRLAIVLEPNLVAPEKVGT